MGAIQQILKTHGGTTNSPEEEPEPPVETSQPDTQETDTGQ